MSAVTIFPAWKDAVARIVGGEYGYGDLISHEAIDELLQLDRPTGRMSHDELKAFELRRMSGVSSLQDALLREHMMDMQNDRGRGYRILKPAEQTEHAVKSTDGAIRKAIREKRTRLFHVDHSQLTTEQRKENTDAIIQAAAQTQALRLVARGVLPELPKRIRKLQQEA